MILGMLPVEMMQAIAVLFFAASIIVLWFVGVDLWRPVCVRCGMRKGAVLSTSCACRRQRP